MDLLRWTACFILGVPAALFILGNWCVLAGLLAETVRGRTERSVSFAPPFLAGLAGAVACLVCPVAGVRSLAWLPLVLDPSILLGVVCLMLYPITRAFGVRSPFDPKLPSPS